MPSKHKKVYHKSKEEKTFHKKQLNKWLQIIQKQLPNLTKSQAYVLALWSFGMVIIRSSAITSVSFFLACLFKAKEEPLGTKQNTFRQRLREFCYDSVDKKGDKRKELEVETCFHYLIKWIIKWWNSNQLAIALDATTLELRFTILTISVVYRGCAIPVAWTMTKGNEKGEWNTQWFRMLSAIKTSVPNNYMVIVMTDRGLYSPKLYKYIVKLRWHPLMRINAKGYFKEGDRYFQPIKSFAKEPNTSWQGRGIAFKNIRLECTLIAHWEQGEEEQWFILTDLPPESSDACLYGMRWWIESGFKAIKSGFFQWDRTKMKDPARASRLWLVISVSMIWIVSVGGEVDESIPASTVPDITENGYPVRIRRRQMSVCRLGWITILASLIRHDELPFGRFLPELWSDVSKSLAIQRYLRKQKLKTYP
jgi:hypothetical protein